MKGEPLQDIKCKKSYPVGKEMVQQATEGTIKEAASWYRQAAREDFLLHEGRRLDLRCRIL
jgi:hypothetical protein